MTNTKNTGLGLQQTKGNFQIIGKVVGVEKDRFYSELTTKSGKAMRIVNFGVEINPGQTVYVTLNGMERDNVYFSCQNKDTKKTMVETVPWRERHSFNKPGFRIIGVNVGLEKIVNSKGESVNDKRNMTEFDACEYISEHLTDGMSVFIKGNVEYSTYNEKHQTKFVPSQISLLSKPIDFDNAEYSIMSDFKQQIVLMGVNKHENGEDFVVSAKIVDYNSIEDAEFIIHKNRAALATAMRKLKPYTAILVFGNIEVVNSVVTSTKDDDVWGKNPFTVSAPTIRRLVITGGEPDTIDTTIYNEKDMEEAIARMNAKSQVKVDFADTNDDDDDVWGSGNKNDDIDDDWD